MPNTFAYVMLMAWPLVVLVLFRRMTMERAFIWTILGGYLILPPVAEFNLPLIPPLDKHSIPTLCALIAVSFHQGSIPRLLPQSIAARIVLAVFLLSGLGTVLTNSDPIIVGSVYVPALPPSEMIIGIISQFIVVLPMLMAQDLLRRPEHMREIVLALALAGLIYSVPMLVEIRLSPQMNVWVYGFFQSFFDQMMRYGGFRPIVFLEHGLWVAFLAFMAAFSALSLLKNETERKPLYFTLAAYLVVVLVLCKSASALIYIVCFGAVLMLLGRRTKIRIAAVIGAIVVLYPLLRGAGLIPTEAILNQAVAMDEERSRSLAFRLINEDLLLEHASSRPLFGWGGWGRNHVLEPLTGRTITVTDGSWIIAIGVSGWLGYLGMFGMLTMPLFLLAKRLRSKALVIAPYAATLALVLGANLIDLIPNATLIPFTWLIGGALLGYASSRETEPALAEPVAKPARPAPWAKTRAPVS